MAREIRFFLFVQRPDASATITVLRSASDLFNHWASITAESSLPTALLFAGETRPALSEITPLLQRVPNRLLLAASALWLLPTRNEIMREPIGEIAAGDTYPSMPVFMAASGWGYEIEGGREASQYYLTIAASGNSDPDKHIERDHERFLQILPNIDRSNPFEIARIAPAWAIPLSIQKLPLTTRCANVMTDQEIVAIGDLTKFTVDQALRWSNFGRKSVADLATSLLMVLRAGPVETADSPPPLLQPELTDEPPLADTLLSGFERTVSALHERHRVIIEGRLAWAASKRTLEDIAQELSLTRERVRQIEERTFARWSSRAPWIEGIQRKLALLRTKRVAALYLDLIAAEDPWFVGFVDRLPCLIELVTRFGGEGCNICFIQGRPVVCSLDTEGWENLKARVLMYFKTRRSTGLDRGEAGYVIDGFLQAEHCPELSSELWDELSELLQFGTLPGSDVEQLLEVGKTLAKQLRTILEQSDEPLHYRDLHQQYEVESGATTTVRNVHAALSRSGALYYGHGKYGTWRHFPIPAGQREDILTEVEEIISEQPAVRQWHATELFSLLQERRPDLPDVMNKHLLNLLLADSNQLRSVGRSVWSAAEGHISSANRIDIMDACLTILIRNDGPMSAAALKSAITQIRGVSEFFCINPTERMTRVAPSVWGLVDRDFYLSRDQREVVTRIVAGDLGRSQRGLHISELAAVVRREIELPERITSYMLVSLCQVDPLLNVYRGQYVGLASWGNSRRSTISDVLSDGYEFFSQARSIEEIVSFVSSVVGRGITGQEVVNVLKLHGFQFDHERKLWVPELLEGDALEDIEDQPKSFS